MPEYRLYWGDRLNIKLEEFRPAKEKKGGGFTQPRWVIISHFGGKWDVAIKSILNKKICPVGDDLQSQLENVPDAIDRATQEIINNIEIVQDEEKIYIMF